MRRKSKVSLKKSPASGIDVKKDHFGAETGHDLPRGRNLNPQESSRLPQGIFDLLFRNAKRKPLEQSIAFWQSIRNVFL
jgi:hypothetical protein